MRSKQFLVIGVGRFGGALARSLYRQGHEVVVIDQNDEKVERIMDEVTHALIADSTDEDVLREIGVGNFDTVVVSIGADFEASIMTTVASKNLGARHLVAKATSETAAAVLRRIGADLVVRPEHDMGLRLAQQLTTPELVDAFNLGEDHSVIEVEANGRLTGSLSELRLPNRFSVQVIAVNRDGNVVVSPSADFEIVRGDNLVLIGNNEAMERFRSFLSE
ncbi:MAG: TrkA family potassium uptake protein [Trueperaceae bacterium]